MCIVYNHRGLSIGPILQKLNNSGLETYHFYSVEQDSMIIKIRADVERLSKHATDIGFNFLLDAVELKEAAEGGIPNKVRPICIPHDPEITDVPPYSYIYSHFPDEKDTHLLSLFAHADGLNHPFSSSARIKLLKSLIRKDVGLDIDRFLDEGAIDGYFPFKDDATASPLFDKINDPKALPWDFPVDDVRHYLGEDFGFFFALLAHYTSLLFPMSIIGLAMFLLLVVTDSLQTGSFFTPIYALVVCAWAQLTIDLWKRSQAVKAMEWGMTNYHPEEVILSTFEGEIRPSVVDGSPMKYFPLKEKLVRQIVSGGALVGAFLLSLFQMVAFFIINLVFGSTITYILVALVIYIITGIIEHVSTWLTIRENHRTESEFDQALIVKLFVFEFINSYGMLFYLAFFRVMMGDSCDSSDGSCMGELSYALFIIFTFRVVVANANAYIWPLIEPFCKSMLKSVTHHFLEWYSEEFPDAEDQPENSPHREVLNTLKDFTAKSTEEEEKLAKKKQLMEFMSKTELEYNLDNCRDSSYYYIDLCIQFGYVTLFVASFPLAPVFAVVSNYLKIRIDAYGLLCSMRRPFPKSANGIGVWLDCLQAISYLSIITNSGIVCFTIGASSNFQLFFCMQYFIFGVILAVNYCVPNVPASVSIQLQRQELLLKKVIEAVPDTMPRHFDPFWNPEQLAVERNHDDC